MTEGIITQAHIHHLQQVQDSIFLPDDLRHHRLRRRRRHHRTMKSAAAKKTSSSFSSCSSSSSSIGDESTEESSSMSSSDSSATADDASSYNPNPYDLSEIMSQLPIKRGLSKFYTGKSESFTALAKVKTLEDLAKKTTSISYRTHHCNHLKASKSCGNVLRSYNNNNNNNKLIPKPTISKKTHVKPSSCFAASPFHSAKRGTFFMATKPPLSPLNDNN
ncbi:protein OXIDATIVE STRESS 3-like [Andrographis paniculata]|uniref:protein OXIDATIVE STRESS 3-like n=1 Tax=Andrographis paniculata TaxID=175694 RepID=UPI0021E98380|nr:protein OXIDATIVE STRESS 3-like [Andrographis paniculata]